MTEEIKSSMMLKGGNTPEEKINWLIAQLAEKEKEVVEHGNQSLCFEMQALDNRREAEGLKIEINKLQERIKELEDGLKDIRKMVLLNYERHGLPIETAMRLKQLLNKHE